MVLAGLMSLWSTIVLVGKIKRVGDLPEYKAPPQPSRAVPEWHIVMGGTT